MSSFISYFLIGLVVIIFLFFIGRRSLYYRKKGEESVQKKDYADAMLCAKKIGDWRLISDLAEKIEKNKEANR